MTVKAETRSFYEQAVERAVRHIIARLDEALELRGLARHAGMSPFHFHRVFRGLLGETPLELQRRLRLERAAAALLGGDERVTALAFDAGYETHEAFTRAFRRAYGVSPSSFRQRAGATPAGCERPPSVEITAPCGLHVHRLGEPLALLFNQGASDMNVVIENLPALRIAALHHVGPYQNIGEAFGRLGALAGPAGLFRPGSMMIGLYHDDPDATPADELGSEAGVSIPEGVSLPDGLTEIKLAAGRYAKTTHVGPYDQLHDVWSRFVGQWLPSSGERIGDGPSLEVYHNTPADAPPSQLRTDLYIPLA
ncbi:MAG TPA: AraC family transcriptional regulator [Polyangia bacterium]